jgi:HAD superfamily hydrolase (TIGR01509 family)
MTTRAAFGVIFDMDGVLIDSVGRNWQAHNEVLAQYGVHVRDDEIADYVGRALPDQLATIKQRFGVDIDLATFEEAIAPIEDRLHAHVVAKPGVTNLIKALIGLKVPIAVGTSTPRDAALKRLRTAGIDHYFEVIATRDEVERHKPDPSVYLYAARQLKLEPGRCIVIEDAPSGLAAAHNAAMKCVAVTVPYVPEARMRAADLVVTSLEQVTPTALELLL